MPRLLARVGAFLKPVERANKRFFFAVLGVLWRNRPLAARLERAAVRRVLVLRHDAIGDMLTTLPTFTEIKRWNPDAAIDVIASPRNRAVIDHDPNVDTIIELGPGLCSLVRALRAARRWRYEVIVCAIYGRSTAVGIIANLIGGRRAVKATIWKGEPYAAYFNVQSRAAAADQPMWERTPRLLADVLAGYEPALPVTPYVAIPDAATEGARSQLAVLGLAPGEYLLVNLSVSHDRNVWGEANYSRFVAAMLERRPSLNVLLLAMPGDRSAAGRIAGMHADRVAVYPHTDNLMEVIAVVKGAMLVFSSDTGVVHMASATGRPVAAMYAGTVAASEWGPYAVPRRIIATEHEEPVATIPVERAVAALDELLAEPGVASASD